MAERNWLEPEVTAAKEALREVCGQELLTLVPEFKTNRQGNNKKSKEIEDIMKAVVALQNNNIMPLVIASSGMMGRCPSSRGQPDAATSQDLMGKVHMLEEVMSNFMEQQRKQMDNVCQELAAVRVVGAAGPRTPRTQVDHLDTPGKRKRMEEAQQEQEENMVTEQPSYLNAALAGVKPLG